MRRARPFALLGAALVSFGACPYITYGVVLGEADDTARALTP
ncbi:MAG TPA: hypothetical protein VF152_15125 [Acidimicrobiia bacterium]